MKSTGGKGWLTRTAEGDAHEPAAPVTLPTVSERGATAGAQPAMHDLARGTTVGRFVVLDRLGTGGMGIVYRAYDPELNRRIAIKLVASRRHAGAKERLLREAQALAQVKHPNVVTVHDAGTYGDDVYVAMELIEGTTLRRWLESRARSQREILSVFAAAGRGLAAAHRVDLVHRDFKPDNVMIDEDGRVRVLDFGLARATNDSSLDSSVDESPVEDVLHQTITNAGTRVGTPIYMSPEQRHDLPVDARSDQFSFCLTLNEALFGGRPFARPDGDADAGAEREVDIALMIDPRARGRLRRILRKGLAADPSQRHASMDELLAELERLRTGGQRWLAVAAIAVVAGGATIGIGAMGGGSARQACPVSDTAVNRIWNAGVQATLEERFAASQRPYARAAARTVAARMTDYAETWTGQWTDACEATHVRREQSPELLDRRMACLDRRLALFSALVSRFAAADADVVDHAVEALGVLAPPQDCADREALLGAPPLPADPQVRAEVQAITRRLAEARVEAATTDAFTGGELLGSIAQAAALTGYAPIELAALQLKAENEIHHGDGRAAETTLAMAARAAARAADDQALARILLGRANAAGFIDSRAEEGLRLADLAEIAIIRAGNPPRLLMELHAVRGLIGMESEAYEDSLREFQTAAAMAREGSSFDEPQDADLHRQIGIVLHAMRREDEAKVSLDRALTSFEKSYGPDHPALASTLVGLAEVHWSRGEPEEARRFYARVFDVVGVYGPQSYRLGHAKHNYAVMLFRAGSYDLAEPHERAALDIYRAASGADNPRTALVQAGLGAILHRAGKPEEARTHLLEALAILEAKLGAAHPWTVDTRMELAACLTSLGRAADALAHLEPALAAAQATPSYTPREFAELRFERARARWHAGQDRPHAVTLAREAAGDLDDDSSAKVRADVWLRQRGIR